ncbi:MAG: hypothetical protein AAF085_08330 [Planctomycetota bacterium]
MKRKRRPTLLPLIYLAALLSILVLPMTGCDTPPSADTFRAAIEQAQQTSADLDQVIADATTELEGLPEGKERDELLEVIAKTTEEKARVDEVLSELQTRLEAAGEDADAIDAAAIALQGLGSTVPPPWSLYLTAGGSVLLAVNRWLKATRTQKAAERVIISIEQEKASNGGTIDFEDKAVKASLRSRMGPDAQDLVEQARDKAGPILIGAPLTEVANAA